VDYLSVFSSITEKGIVVSYLCCQVLQGTVSAIIKWCN